MIGRALLLVLVAAATPALSRPVDAPCANMKTFALGDSCVTCRGVRVARVRRGFVHGVTVDGRFWTDALVENYTNAAKMSAAEKACRDKGAGLRLPTKDDVLSLTQALHHDAPGEPCSDYRELNAVMPDGRGRHFWTSSADADAGRAASFWGTTDGLSTSPRAGLLGVRCVAEPGAPAPSPVEAPVDHFGAAPDAEGSAITREFSFCKISLVQDSGVGEEAAVEACKSRDSRDFVFCVYHLVNAGGAPAAAVESCLVKPPTPPVVDAGKLDRFLKSCAAGNLLGCTLAGKEKERAGDKAGARSFFQKACDGGFKPGCEGLGR